LFDGLVRLKLLATETKEVTGCNAIAGQEPMQATAGRVTRPAGIADEHAPAAATED
jgi:hypothetical protein